MSGRVLMVCGAPWDDAAEPHPDAENAIAVTHRLAERLGTRPTVVLLNDQPRVAQSVADVADALAMLDLEAAPSVQRLRSLRQPALASRAKGRLLRQWLDGHRTEPVYLDGASAKPFLPWLSRHQAPIVWHLHAGEQEAASGSDAAVATTLLITDPSVAAPEAEDGTRRIRVPVHRPDPPVGRPPRDQLTVGLLGAPDLAHGADLLPRLLWLLERAAATPVLARWAVGDPEVDAAADTDPVDTVPSCRSDLRRLGLTDRVAFEASKGDAFLGGIDALALPWRQGPLPTDTLWRAAGAGVPTVAFDTGDQDRTMPAAVLHPVAFPDLDALVAQLLALIDTPDARLATANAARTAHAGDLVTDTIISALFPDGAP